MRFEGKKQIIILAVSAAVLVVFALLQYFPMRRRMQASKQSAMAQKAALDESALAHQRLPELRSQFIKLQGQVGNFDARIPEGRNIGDFLQQIAGIMSDHELRRPLIEPGDEIVQKVKHEELICIPVTIRCQGRLEQIFEFSKSLQSMDRLIRIEQIELKNDNNYSGRVDMMAKAVIYYGVSKKQNAHSQI